VSLDVSQDKRGNPVVARRFFGRKANGMGGRQTPRCLAEAHGENRVRSGLDYSFEWFETRFKAMAGAFNQCGCSGEFEDSEVELVAMGGGHRRGNAVVTVDCRHVL
jgi:hypothetical protein